MEDFSRESKGLIHKIINRLFSKSSLIFESCPAFSWKYSNIFDNFGLEQRTTKKKGSKVCLTVHGRAIISVASTLKLHYWEWTFLRSIHVFLCVFRYLLPIFPCYIILSRQESVDKVNLSGGRPIGRVYVRMNSSR